ncbi:MAG: UDP-N-acetylmuramate dehydrogenase [Lachnospiraceae bacterium]|nr:UDP-N-acetylmuramate dehydrogenase [Lachnospiraceae bacterium]
MWRYTTFRVGGDASYLVNVENEEILTALLKLLKQNDMPYYLLGNGSNLLVSDQGYDGVMIRLGGDFSKIEWRKQTEQSAAGGDSISDDEVICHAGAAVMLTNMAQKAAEQGSSGLEFAYGIPGTVGGAIVMNAGAYGGEMCQVVESVRLLDENLQIVTLKGDEMAFGYRTSILKKKPYVVLSVRLKLHPGDKKEIMAKMNTNMSARKEKQPLEYPSAGSTFKRPEGYFAGKLIQDAGLRGYRVGGAQVSEKHCGFVINMGNATAADIYHLISNVQSKVREIGGVTLEPEVIMLGEF